VELKLVSHTSKALTTKCGVFRFDEPQVDAVDLSMALVKLMRDANGLGLAANQCGLSLRVFAMRSDPNTVCFNPRIVSASEEVVEMVEGCLTFPGMQIKLKRPAWLKLRYQRPNGETISNTYMGLAARIVQHEMDHLDGLLFYNRAYRFHRDRALRQWRAWKKKHPDAPFVPPEAIEFEANARKRLLEGAKV